MSVRILEGDCLDLLPTLDAESVDAVVTDPPYGIGFMGREWDTFSLASVAKLTERRRRKGTERTSAAFPTKMGTKSQGGGVQVQYDERPSGNARFQAWCTEWLAECLRVLKPGAPLLVFGGVRTYHRLTCAVEDVGFELKDCLMWLHGNGFPKHKTLLKPAWEPIVVAKKPGPGGLNTEDGRIEAEPDRDMHGNAGLRNARYGAGVNGGPVPHHTSNLGRWPANVVLDEAAAAALDEQTGTLRSGKPGHHRLGVNTSFAFGAEYRKPGEPMLGYGDAGGASRFFYVAKASRSERDAGLDELPRRPLIWSSGEQNPGSFQSEGTDKTARNHHPTVKPLSLMRWLVRLACPAGGLVLDPFGGSGTTGVACVLEERDCVLIEREREYADIARRRVAHAEGPLFVAMEAAG